MHEQPDRSPTATKIMDAAEDLARAGGYDAFSFREIAKALDIKSASVHYHFPAKGDLAAAIVTRYTDTLLADLPDSADPNQPADALLAAFSARYRRMVAEEELGCLLAIFAAETGRLPLEAAAATRDGLARLATWLTPLFARRGDPDPAGGAHACLAQLQGAVTIARAHDAVSVFDAIAIRALRR